MIKYIFPIVLLLAACGEDTKTVDKPKGEIVKSFKNEAEMDEYMQELDALVAASGTVANSLHYEKSDGTMIEVIGHMDRDNKIHIVEEQFAEGAGKTTGVRFFYLNQNGKPFATHEQIDEITGDQAQFVERITYYDSKGKVLKTKERRAQFQDEIDRFSYKPAPKHAISIDRAWRALNSEKEFETTFQGFVYQDVMSYLIVGENSKDGFTSALRLDYKDLLIQQLNNDPDAYIGEKLTVNFQVHEDRGLEFQIYAGGKFVK